MKSVLRIGGEILPGVTAVGLLSLVLVSGCQKDQVEECVNDGVKSFGAAWIRLPPDEQAQWRFDFRRLCMKAAAGQ
jgi:hypothetical protein